MAEEDEQLVRTAQKGAGPEAQRAFAALVDRWKGPVYRIARRRLHDDHDSEEVASDTFVLAWKALRTLRDPAAFPGWILRIAANRASSRIKELRMSRSAGPLDLLLHDAEAPGISFVHWRALQDAFGDVPEDSLNLLRLKHEDGRTYEQIAAAQGIAVSTVRDRLSRARGQVEDALRKHGLIEDFARLLEQRRRGGRGGAAPDGVEGSDG